MSDRGIRSPRARAWTAAAISLPLVAAAAVVQMNSFAAPPSPKPSATLHSYVCAYVYANNTWKLRNGNNPAYVKNSVLLNLKGNEQQRVAVGDRFHAGTSDRSVLLYVVAAANLTQKLPASQQPICPASPNVTPSSPGTSSSTATTSTPSKTTPASSVTTKVVPAVVPGSQTSSPAVTQQATSLPKTGN